MKELNSKKTVDWYSQRFDVVDQKNKALKDNALLELRKQSAIKQNEVAAQPAKPWSNPDEWRKHRKKSIAEQVFDRWMEKVKPEVKTDKKELARIERENKKREWRIYYDRVWTITKEQQLTALDGFEQREFRWIEIDHKVSVWEGWKYGFPPQWVGSLANLRIITGEENRSKGRRSVPECLEAMIKRKRVNDIYNERILEE